MRHPIQPIVVDDRGTPRFKENAIVAYLLANGPFSLNDLAREKFTREDRDQFAMLIGYSVRGAPLSNDVRAVVDRMQVDGQDPQAAELEALRARLTEVREGMRIGVAALFDIHPDDLGGQDD